MTGDTENGRSISVIRNALPRNSYLAIAQAAATPNTRLAGTAIAATISVKLDRGDRVRIGERGEIGADAAAQRLGKDDDEREQQKQAEEDQRRRRSRGP